jgi:hypothetical protein
MKDLYAILKQQKPPISYVLCSATLISDPASYMHVFCDEWVITVYRRLEINYFSRDNFLQVLAVTFICWTIIMYYRLYRFLPPILSH